MIIPSTCTGKCFIFRPFHPCCHRVTLRLGEFQCFNSSLHKHKCVSWAYSRLANLSVCVEGRNMGRKYPNIQFLVMSTTFMIILILLTDNSMKSITMCAIEFALNGCVI